MKFFILICGLISSVYGQAADCATDQLKGLAGTFAGVLSPVNFQGERSPLENVSETQSVSNCDAFDFDIHYSNPQTHAETREVKFTGTWDKSEKEFALSGPILKGRLRAIRQQQFLLSFDTKFADEHAHCEEMITISPDSQQLVRSVHCFAVGANGQSLGVRSALTTRVR